MTNWLAQVSKEVDAHWSISGIAFRYDQATHLEISQLTVAIRCEREEAAELASSVAQVSHKKESPFSKMVWTVTSTKIVESVISPNPILVLHIDTTREQLSC
jgi:hypothetical protein